MTASGPAAQKVTRAVLLAAGQGTRLRPLTNDRPKPMIEIGGRPLIEHTVRQLVDYGVREIIINLHHCGEVVRDHFGDGRRFDARIDYSFEPRLLGTAGAVKRVAAALSGAPFFVIYGDNLTTCDFGRLAARHSGAAAIATVALFWKDDVTPHSAVELQDDDRITRFVEKPAAEDAPSHWISAGMIVLEPAVLEFIPDERPCDFGFDVFPGLLRAGHRVQGYRMGPGEGLWWIDTPEHYARVSELWKNGAPPI
jgi:NDP-sugar pyrophosphorylase family protein